MEKLYGDNRIHRTRNINSYEADYNLSLKFFWPKTTIQKEDASGSLGCNQYGGRKNRRSNDASFINEMIMEYHRMMYITLSITQHDNTACFDRTVENITTLSNRKFNIPKKICSMTAQIKKTIKYHVTTIHGQSTESYHHHKDSPVHGSGQGSGNAGTEWNFISIPLLKTMEETAEGCIIKGPRNIT